MPCSLTSPSITYPLTVIDLEAFSNLLHYILHMTDGILICIV